MSRTQRVVSAVTWLGRSHSVCKSYKTLDFYVRVFAEHMPLRMAAEKSIRPSSSAVLCGVPASLPFAKQAFVVLELVGAAREPPGASLSGAQIGLRRTDRLVVIPGRPLQPRNRCLVPFL